MTTNVKGTSGLIEVIADLHRRKLKVYLPFDDHSTADLVAVDSSGICHKIQVKYRSRTKNASTYLIHASSVVNGVRVPVDKQHIDVWAIYLADDSKVVYLPTTEFGDKVSKTVSSSTDYKYFGE